MRIFTLALGILYTHEDRASRAPPSLCLSGIAGHCCNLCVFNSTILSRFDPSQPAMILYVANSLEGLPGVWLF